MQVGIGATASVTFDVQELGHPTRQRAHSGGETGRRVTLYAGLLILRFCSLFILAFWVNQIEALAIVSSRPLDFKVRVQ